jgi:hypothetical protein
MAAWAVGDKARLPANNAAPAYLEIETILIIAVLLDKT